MDHSWRLYYKHTHLDNMFVSDGELLHKSRGEIDVTSLTTMTSGEQLVKREALWEAIVGSGGDDVIIAL